MSIHWLSIQSYMRCFQQINGKEKMEHNPEGSAGISTEPLRVSRRQKGWERLRWRLVCRIFSRSPAALMSACLWNNLQYFSLTFETFPLKVQGFDTTRLLFRGRTFSLPSVVIVGTGPESALVLRDHSVGRKTAHAWFGSSYFRCLVIHIYVDSRR